MNRNDKKASREQLPILGGDKELKRTNDVKILSWRSQSRLSVGLDADLRTRSGQEKSVIEQIREDGGFSIFWATETQRRACAIERLQKRGEIRRVGGSYPFCNYELVHNEPS